jgi:hypothetical protein
VAGKLAGGAPEARLSEALDDARERGFVGRAAELASFADALEGSSDVRVLFVHGPGGIGKTTLLDAFARRARAAGRAVRYLDGRDLECSIAAVSAALSDHSPTQVPGRDGDGQPPVLLIDGYELLAPLDGWFRGEIIPARPAGSVTVLAGRAAPAPPWWLDPGWHQLARVHRLSQLDRSESIELLARLGVPPAGRDPMSAVGCGHPLALAMLAEAGRYGGTATQFTDVPDVVGQLCRVIMDDVPDAAHRTGLATCAHATRMTQDLLASTVGARAEEVWRWLESRPYVRRGEIGLFLHDVVRELFEAEFALRAPQAYSELHRTVRTHFIERLADRAEPHPGRAAAELLLLDRRSPLSPQVSALRDGGLRSVLRAGPDDHAEIVALVERFEGAGPALLARRWIEQQPQGLYRLRSDRGIEGFSLQVYLPAPRSLVDSDPVAAAVLEAVERHGPLRPGEQVGIGRFAGAPVDYQRDPMTLLVMGVSCILEWASHPVAWTFIITTDPAHYGPYFEYLGLSPIVAVAQGDQTAVGYGWDRRRFPVPAFFELMARRELSGETGPPMAELLRPEPLSRAAFEAAIRQALPHLNRADRLATSPLLGTALVVAGTPDPVAGLQAVMRSTVAALGLESRGQEHRRVLERTYLRGVPSQEVAAELLQLPFSTYRRHLAKATERLIEVLWSIEIGERPAAGDRAGTEPEVSSE